MKLLIITVVEAYQKDVFKLLKEADIKNFSESDIDGYKNVSPVIMTSSWFPSKKGGAQSRMFFSFTENEKIEYLFKLIKTYNNKLETNNPIKAIVVPIENYI